MLLELRAQLADGDPKWDVARANPIEKIAYTAWSHIVDDRRLYDLCLKAGNLFQKLMPMTAEGMIRRLPKPLDGWTRSRDLPPLARKRFAQRYKERNQ